MRIVIMAKCSPSTAHEIHAAIDRVADAEIVSFVADPISALQDIRTFHAELFIADWQRLRAIGVETYLRHLGSMTAPPTILLVPADVPAPRYIEGRLRLVACTPWPFADVDALQALVRRAGTTSTPNLTHPTCLSEPAQSMAKSFPALDRLGRKASSPPASSDSPVYSAIR